MLQCPKCNSMASTGASDCPKCGHQFTPGVDSPEVSPWWFGEPLALLYIGAKVGAFTISSLQAGRLDVAPNQYFSRQSAAEMGPLMWWALILFLGCVAVGCVLRAVLVVANHMRRR